MGRRDDGSFEQFAERALPRLLRTAWLLTGDATRAEDAAQEALVRVYVVWPRIRLEEPEAYCHRVLRNHVVSQWRRERRLVLVDEVRDDVRRDEAGRGGGSEPGQRVDLVRALQALPQREREVVVLRHYADLSERTVADLLGVSVGTVKSSSSRGLERLRGLIDDKGEARVELADVLADGRRRVRRRRAAVASAVAAAAVVAAVVATGALTAGGRDRTSTPPAATSAPATPPTTVPSLGSRGWQPQHPDLSGRATITTAAGSFAVSVTGGVMTVRATDQDMDPVSAALLRSGAVWRQVPGRTGQPVLVGVVPGAAERVVYQPAEGGTMAPHHVATARAGDFTAYVISFDQPSAAIAVASDVGWLTSGADVPAWTMGEGASGSVGIALDLAGQVPSLLAPYDATVTGPPAATTPTREAVVSFTVSFEERLDRLARLELLGGATAAGTGGREVRVEGPDPESAFGWASVPLVGGRTLVWGVLPQGVATVDVRATGGALVGTPVVDAGGGGAHSVFAVLVEGRPDQVVELEATFTGRAGGIGVIR